MNIQLYNGDCLIEMNKIADKSVDMILADLPYGTSACKWDIVIPFEPLWEQYNRIIKDDGAIVLFASQPFTTKLINSNIKNFKYEWIWQKTTGSNFAILKYQPMKEHEYILVFKGLYSKSKIKYFPIKEQRKGSGASRVKYRDSKTTSGEVSHRLPSLNKTSRDNLRYPSSIQYFNNRDKERGLHPTQKPVALLEYLIKTYTNEGDIVLDNVMGSGSTGVACINMNRHFIGIEKEEKYYQIAKKRIAEVESVRITKQKI